MLLKSIVASGLLAAAAYAQSSNSNQNLTQLISSNSELSGLATLLQAYPGVTSSLESAKNVTLLAPNNQALQAVQSVLAGGQQSTSSLVNALLSYHVIQGEFFASNISSTPAFPHTTLNNTNYTTVTGGQVVECRLVGNKTVEITSGLKMIANVTQANLNFTGGVVHIINNVLAIPPNFTATAVDANLTALVGAVEATNLTSAIGGLKDVTIFAPSNTAFQDISTALSNLSTTAAADILKYHVINGTIAYSSSLANTTIRTLGGGNITITVANGNVFINSAKVINPDILISNGVVHVIDAVLNPNNTAAANGSSTSTTVAYSGASSGSQVPFTSGVPTPATTIMNLITTVPNVVSGYTTVEPAGGAATSTKLGSSSSKGVAAVQTAAVGAAALFGGAAFLANM